MLPTSKTFSDAMMMLLLLSSSSVKRMWAYVTMPVPRVPQSYPQRLRTGSSSIVLHRSCFATGATTPRTKLPNRPQTAFALPTNTGSMMTSFAMNHRLFAAVASNSPSQHPFVEISPTNHGTQAISDFQHIDHRLLRTLNEEQWTKPTTIQSHAIPLLSNGYDVMASSQTGSGKSLMFCLPLMEKLLLSQQQRTTRTNTNSKIGMPRALVVSPTRELALQTATVLNTLGRYIPWIRVAMATGGSNVSKQRQQLMEADIVVGTPGRILQFADEQQLALHERLEYMVIDEADRLLDLGFEPQLTRIAKLVRRRRRQQQQEQLHQSLLCSATFPIGVQRLAADFLQDGYYFVSVGRVGSTHNKIRQTFEWAETPTEKEAAIVRHASLFLQKHPKHKAGEQNSQSSIIVFANTKEDAERFGLALRRSRDRSHPGHNKVTCRVIHGDKCQEERNRSLRDFKDNKFNVLVATDVAARGLDITSIGLVIQADAPRDVDSYTHRIGALNSLSGNTYFFFALSLSHVYCSFLPRTHGSGAGGFGRGGDFAEWSKSGNFSWPG